MRLSQCERDEIITALEKAWKHEFQLGLAISLVSRVKEVTQYPSWSPYLYQPKTAALIRKIQEDLTAILRIWAEENMERNPNLRGILDNTDMFYIRVTESEDPNSLDVLFSPDILLLHHGNSPINVFNWAGWSDDSLKNNYDKLLEKGKI